MLHINLKRYGLYLLRWQLSTPLLALCVIMFASLGTTWATIIANFCGGCIFFFIDKMIFQSEKLDASWQIKEKVQCSDCGKIARGYRLVRSKNYDKSHDKHPKFRCETCSTAKSKKMKRRGVQVESDYKNKGFL
jgi:hypothetical protein